MLTAFHARPFIELKQRDKSKIDAILAYGNRLLVGLNNGSLRVYRVNDPAPTAPSKTPDGPQTAEEDGSDAPSKAGPADLLREVEKFSRRSIEQLALVKEANLLVSLSDGYVSIHDLQSPNFDVQEQLAKAKGATTFAVTSNIVKDPSTGIPSIVSRLVVVVKRKLLVWSWHDSELSSETSEILLTATARTLTWSTATRLVCGLNSGYVLVDIESKDVSEIAGPGSIGGTGGQEGGRFGGVGTAGMGYMGMGSWIPKPLATKLANEELLLAKDINTTFIDLDGKALQKRQVPWSGAPEAIGFSYPYLLALQAPTKGVLEIRNPETQSLLQSIPLQNASLLHVPQPNVSLAHAGKGFLVASDRVIWRMEAENYEVQVEQLVGSGHLDEAISLLEMIEDALLDNKDESLREVKIQKAQTLFDQKRYRESLDLFTEVAAPPERVLRLYPRVISGDHAMSAPSVDETNEISEEPAPENANGEPDAANSDRRKIQPRSRKGQAQEPKSGHRKKPSDTASVKSSVKGKLDSDKGSNQSDQPEGKKENIIEGKDLKNAVLELYGFLVQTRTQLQSYLNPDGSLKYNAQSPGRGAHGSQKPAFESLLVAPSSSADIDREQKLRDAAKLVDTTLFRAYMVENPARAGSLFRISNFCDPEVVKEKLLENKRYEDLVDFLHGKKLHRSALELLRELGDETDETEISPALRGPRRTVSYLQSLPSQHVEIILEFARWPLEQDPDLGMDIFLTDTENAETLPRDEVIHFLESLDKRLTIRYLEHIISELNDLTLGFHQKLVNLYLERLRGQSEAFKPQKSNANEEIGEWRQKLLEFLQSSSQYSTAKTFQQLPSNEPDFYEARAIVLSKMGNHKQALEIYVFKIGDHEKAEEYCNRVHLAQESGAGKDSRSSQRRSSNTDQSESIYHTLLSLYLTPPPPQQADWQPALKLLGKHGARLSASSTLSLIPTSLPVKELESYFRGRIRSANSITNESRIVTGLQKTELVAAQAGALLGDGLPNGNRGRNRSVVISDERVCGVCHRRLGGSAISVFPE
ncbi:MAG: Vacuolar morphogenesis protein 6 [Piccolia ochrophora]|nr:MAG: Vacuolar morphogenesis protein 6 [Piccolia ochrophora]